MCSLSSETYFCEQTEEALDDIMLDSPNHLCLQYIPINWDNYAMSHERLILTGFMGVGKSTV